MEPHTLPAVPVPAKMIVSRDAHNMPHNTSHNTSHNIPYDVHAANYEFSQRKFMTALARTNNVGLCADQSYKQRAIDNFDARTHKIKVYPQYKGNVKIE